MNTKGIRFLAVLAVMVMAFAAIAIAAPAADDSEGMGTNTTSYVPVDPVQLEEVIIGGVSADDATFGEKQKVVVEKDWTIGNLTQHPTITINGELSVPEGVKVVVTSGAKLIINGTADIEGTVELEEAYVEGALDAGLLQIGSNGVAVLSASSYIDGEIEVYGCLGIASGATLTIGTSAILNVATAVTGSVPTGGELIVDEGAGLVINGTVSAFEISNYGYVTIDTDEPAAGNVNIYQLMDGAMVDITSFTVAAGYALTVSDYGMIVYTQKNGNEITEWYIDTENYNVISLTAKTITNWKTTIAGLVITEKLTSTDSTGSSDIGYVKEAGKIFKNYMNLEGNVAASVTYTGTSTEPGTEIPEASIGLIANYGAQVIKDTELEIGLDITMNVQGKMTVAGDIILDAKTSTYTGASGKITFTSTPTITLTGAGTITYANDSFPTTGATVKAAQITLDKTNKVYQLLTLDAALAMDSAVLADQTIKTRASLTVTTDSTLQAGVTLLIGDDHTVTIKDGVTLSVEATAKVKGNIVDVKGTMEADVATDITATKVKSDVKTQEIDEKGKIVTKGWVNYTNLYSALANTESGKIIVTTTDGLTISKSITIKEGVTLEIPAAATPVISRTVATTPVVITIKGTLDVGTTITGADYDAGDKFVITGDFKTSETSYDAAVTAYEAAGAYYLASDGYAHITTLATAVSSEVANINVYGKVNETSAVVADGQTITLDYGDLNVTDLTLNESKIVSEGGSLSGEITGITEEGFAVLQVSKYYGTIESAVVSSKNYTYIDDIAGNVTIVSGQVVARDMANLDGDFTIANGAEFIIPSGVTVIFTPIGTATEVTLNVNGTLTVAEGGDLTINAIKLNIAGTIHAVASTAGNAEIDFVDISAIKTGTITIDDGAEFNLAYTAEKAGLALGTQPTSVGASVTVVGNVNLDTDNYIIAYPGTDVSKMTINAVDGVSTGKATKFVLNGTEIATIYVATGTTLTIEDVIGTSADDKGIIDFEKIEGVVTDKLYEPETWGFTDSGKIGDIETASATAPASKITIRTSHVIGASLFIDGVRIQQETYTLTVGTHTLSGSVDPGYEGSIVFTYKGVTVQGGQFTVAVGDDDAVLALGGDIHAVEPEVPEDKSGEITITEILLIVLVILIAVMCVVLILRLNRS